MNPTLEREIIKTFIQNLKDLAEQKKLDTFIKDFLTEEELETYAKRLAIAYWIKKGRDEENIERNLKAAKKEIAKVRKQMEKEGMKIALKNLEADEWANVWAERIKKFAGN